MNSGSDRSMSYPNCWNCRHFFITFEKNHRYGCRAMGFKAKELPSLEVLQTDGSPCLSFSHKLLEDSAKQNSTSLPQNRGDSFINLKC